MKKFAVTSLAAAMVLSIVVTGCGAPLPEVTESTETVPELGPASPKDDFYRYVNEERFEDVEFEYGTSTARAAFDQKMIDDQIEEIIDDVVAGSGYEKGSEEYIIKNAYDLYSAYDFENEPIPEELVELMDEIQNASSIEELMQIDAKLVRDYGLSGFLNVGPDVDPFDPTRRVMTFVPLNGVMGVSFQDMRDQLYAIDSVRDDAILILTVRGCDEDTAGKYGTELANIAIDLFSATDLEAFEDPMSFKYCSIYSKSQVDEVFTNVDIDAYLKEIGFDISKVDSYCVSDDDQLVALNAIFTEDNLNALKTWELGNLITQYGKYISPHYTQMAGYIGRDYSSDHDKAVREISNVFESETDPIYVERHYSKEMDDALIGMCDDIRAGYREIISNATWLSQETRDELLRKLENIVYVTGMDLERHDTAEYKNLNTENYFKFCLSYHKISVKEQIDSLGEPVSRKDILMPMQMFNACYNPSFNNITITVAITNAPFFDVNADYYTNLGGLGMVIAHEMGHAFDSNCILFNSKGEYDPSWIKTEDMDTLIARNDKAVEYFESFVFFGVYHVDGEQTLGENYADLGAMECVSSLATTQEDRERLFESFATIWCQICTDEQIIDQVAYDVHSPAVIRVNAVCSTLDVFYETYDIQEGDGMYVAPENRISRWY